MATLPLKITKSATCQGRCERTLYVHRGGQVLVYSAERTAYAVVAEGAVCQECGAPVCGNADAGCRLERCDGCGGGACVWCFGGARVCPSCADLARAGESAP